MARYIGPVCKLCRREGEKLFLKGERCYSPKCAMERRAYVPGQHGQSRRFRRRQTEYAVQLREKQKARRVYGVLERQFRRYFREAGRRSGLTGENLVIILETRLDNVVYRLGFADSRAQARQLVQHGHFDINGRRTDIPSYLVELGDVLSAHPSSRRRPYFRGIRESLHDVVPPDWLSLDPEAMEARVLALPSREMLQVPFNEQLIVEYYSR
jgi:small subunit ribosomal protein S4